MQATTRDGGNLRGAQRVSQQDAAANNCTVGLGFRRDMEAGGQADIATKNGAKEQCGSTSSVTELPKSTTDRHNKEVAVGGSRSGIPDGGRPDQGSKG